MVPMLITCNLAMDCSGHTHDIGSRMSHLSPTLSRSCKSLKLACLSSHLSHYIVLSRYDHTTHNWSILREPNTKSFAKIVLSKTTLSNMLLESVPLLWMMLWKITIMCYCTTRRLNTHYNILWFITTLDRRDHFKCCCAIIMLDSDAHSSLGNLPTT